MIVQGSKTQVVDVDIDPVSFLSDLEESWKSVIRVPDSDIKAGYWISYKATEAGVIDIRGRLATQREMAIYNAFDLLREVVCDFE
jgi:hypothetical protein